jgi:serine/threonine protein phosphatase PrpC
VGDAYALVIASDGLWDAFEDEDAQQVLGEFVAAVIAKGGGPEIISRTLQDGAARCLVERAKERGSRDNILVLVVFF